MEDKSRQDVVRELLRTTSEDKERRSNANQRAVVGKLPPLLETPSPPISKENLQQISDKELHERLMNAELEELMATSRQPLATLMVRAENAKTTTLDALLVSQIANLALRALEHLAAKGNVVVARELYRTVRVAVANLNEQALNNPGLFKPLAREHIDWPVLYSPHDFFVTDSKPLQDSLEIGGGFHLAVFGKWDDRDRGLDLTRPQNYLAIRAIELLLRTRTAPQSVDSPAANSTVWKWRDEARRLQPLTKATAEEWAKVGWKAVLEAFKGKPEADAFLSPLGNSRRAKARTPGRIRARIKSQFKLAVAKFAQSVPAQL